MESFVFGKFQDTFFYPPKKRLQSFSIFFVGFEVWDLTAVFFNIKNHHGQPLGGHRVSVRGGLEKPSFGMGQNHGKNRQQINMSSMLGAWFFFSSPRWCSRTHIFVEFSGKFREKHTDSMDPFGYSVSLTASKERISRLFSPGFQNRRERRPVKWCSAFFFGGYIKIPWETCQTTFSNPKKVR